MAGLGFGTGIFGKLFWPCLKLLSAPGTWRCSSGGFQQTVSLKPIYTTLLNVLTSLGNRDAKSLAGEGLKIPPPRLVQDRPGRRAEMTSSESLGSCF